MLSASGAAKNSGKIVTTLILTRAAPRAASITMRRAVAIDRSRPARRRTSMQHCLAVARALPHVDREALRQLVESRHVTDELARRRARRAFRAARGGRPRPSPGAASSSAGTSRYRPRHARRRCDRRISVNATRKPSLERTARRDVQLGARRARDRRSRFPQKHDGRARRPRPARRSSARRRARRGCRVPCGPARR